MARRVLFPPVPVPATQPPAPGPLIARIHAELSDRPRAPVRYSQITTEGASAFARLIIGPRTAYDMTGRVKLIDEPLWPITRGEYARPYLTHVHEAHRPKRGMGRDRVPFRTEQMGLLELAHPLHFSGYHRGPLAYVDIEACYWNLYAGITLDVDYWPDPELPRIGMGRLPFLSATELLPLKSARNFVMGIVRSRLRTEIRWGRAVTIRSMNRYLSPCLWGLVSDTLHAMATDVVSRFDCHSVHTDGYIVRAGQAEAVVAFLRDRWGVPARIKARGAGEVFCVGSWRIDDTGSDSLALRHRQHPPHSTLRPPSPALYRRLVAFREAHLPTR